MRDEITIRQEGSRVYLLKNGILIADMPYQAALELSKGLRIKGLLAEEWIKAESIALDNAVLLRAGVPLGLTNHPLILRESIKEAESNRALRRYLPGGIRSREAVGTPTLIQKRPR